MFICISRGVTLTNVAYRPFAEMCRFRFHSNYICDDSYMTEFIGIVSILS